MSGRSSTSARDTRAPLEIAPNVWWLVVGRGIMTSNVYFIGSGKSWVLVDCGGRNCGRAILEAARSLFRDRPATAILLTHDHPDHAGSARELAHTWGCSIWIHPGELPFVTGDVRAFRGLTGPLDRWVILPLLRLQGTRRTRLMIAAASFVDRARTLDVSQPPPGLPDWKILPTPGHTPGHISLLRTEDRVLITGDALVTVDLNTLRGLLSREQGLSAPPWYTTWDRRLARSSMNALLQLRPRIVAGGHGIPWRPPAGA